MLGARRPIVELRDVEIQDTAEKRVWAGQWMHRRTVCGGQITNRSLLENKQRFVFYLKLAALKTPKRQHPQPSPPPHPPLQNVLCVSVCFTFRMV